MSYKITITTVIVYFQLDVQFTIFSQLSNMHSIFLCACNNFNVPTLFVEIENYLNIKFSF